MLYPFLLEPILAPKPWGGDRLARYGKHLPPGELIGESWELSDLVLGDSATVTDGQSRVTNGPLAGRTIRSLIDEFGPELLGSTEPIGGGFPLLIKLIDARQHLSVQVHPTAEYVAEQPGTQLKTESWYVVEAAPGAVIYKGFVPGTTLADVERTVGTSELVDLLDAVPVLAGDIHHLPAGTVHALGAGVIVAEVQTPSDTTFRLYDWTDEYDRGPRHLQIEKALRCLSFSTPPPVEPTQIDLTTRDLVDTPHYWMHEHRSDGGGLWLDPRPGARILMVVDGALTVGEVAAPKGTTVLIPASVTADTVSDQPVVVLEIGLPSQ